MWDNKYRLSILHPAARPQLYPVKQKKIRARCIERGKLPCRFSFSYLFQVFYELGVLWHMATRGEMSEMKNPSENLVFEVDYSNDLGEM